MALVPQRLGLVADLCRRDLAVDPRPLAFVADLRRLDLVGCGGFVLKRHLGDGREPGRITAFHFRHVHVILAPVFPATGDMAATARTDSCTMPIIKLLQSTVELSVPDWVEQARRLGGLLIGVGSQTARPISLAKEWSPIAERVLSSENA